MIRLGLAPEGAPSPRWCIPAAPPAIRLFPVLVLVASCGGGQVLSHASTAALPASAASQPATTTAGSAASAVPEPTGSSSSRRVIVTLSLPPTPGGNLPNEEVTRRQHQSIVEAQDELLADLRPYAVRMLARFNGPQLALLVDQDALGYLRTSPRVVSVQEDVPKPPTG